MIKDSCYYYITNITVKLLLSSMITITFLSSSYGSVWWKTDWKVRRMVIYKPKGNQNPSGCKVSFLTAGFLKEDGSDIRVIGPSGIPVRHRILKVGPGDMVSIVFDAKGNSEKRYFIYYGNPDAESIEDKDWLPEGGLLFESFRYISGNINSAEGIKKTVEDAKEHPLGKAYVTAIFTPGNILSEEKGTANKYSGYLVCNYDGIYTFAISTIDASALFIDEKLVTAWPGRHNWIADTRHNGKIYLTAGMHRFEFYHVNLSGKAGAVVAWKPPKSNSIHILDENAFIPIVDGYISPAENQGKTFTTDFVFRPIRSVKTNITTLYEYEFTAIDNLSQKKGKEVGEFLWYFGDGQIIKGNPVRHVFIKRGVYPVRLERKIFGRTYATVNRIPIGLHPTDYFIREASLKDLRPLISAYNFSTLLPEDVNIIMDIFLILQDRQLAINAGKAYIKKGKVPPEDKLEIFTQIAEKTAGLMKEDKSYIEAAELLMRAAERVPAGSPYQKRLLLRSASIYINKLGKSSLAKELLKTIPRPEEADTNNKEGRVTVIVYGDLYRLEGKKELAERYYRQITHKTHHYYIKVGAYTSAIEDYIRRAEYTKAEELIEAWQEEYPEDKLNPYLLHLEYRLYKLKGQETQAKIIANIMEKIYPLNPYTEKIKNPTKKDNKLK